MYPGVLVIRGGGGGGAAGLKKKHTHQVDPAAPRVCVEKHRLCVFQFKKNTCVQPQAHAAPLSQSPLPLLRGQLL